MKILLLICFIVCSRSAVKAQDFYNYAYIDSKATRVPEEVTYSTAGIANYIQTNFKTDREKVRAVYKWITANIRYSKDSMFYRYWGDDPERKLSSVLKTRKGVCEDYATLFTNIVLKCGIPSFVVTGYTKISGATDRTGHSWCAVKVDKVWLLCDPTWDQDFNNTARYFLVSPTQFIETHFPFDPLWQLLEHPISAKEFKQGSTYSKRKQPVFQYADSADAFMQLDTLQQQVASAARMVQAGLDNENTQTWYAYNQMKIAIVHQENDRTVFNSAVADLNKAKALYNDFVQYRNNKFTPSKPDAAINAVFNSIDSLIFSANKKSIIIGQKTENFQYDTDALKNNLDALATKAQVQKDFLKRYFTSAATEREKLFYQ